MKYVNADELLLDFRHTCEQTEGMAGYGWDRYDPRHGGVQTIHDAGNEIDITTSFVKISDAGDKGGNWAVRIKGTPRQGAHEDLKTTVVFSVSSEGGPLSSLEVVGDDIDDVKGIEGDVVLSGDNPTLGTFKVAITEGKGKHPEHIHPSEEERPLDRTFVVSSTIPQEHLWQTKRKPQQPNDCELSNLPLQLCYSPTYGNH
jgi:mannosyl-oligosaccharide glucosidase